MTAEQYKRISAPFCSEKRKKALNLLNKALTLLCYAAYPTAMALLLFRRDPRLLPCVAVPGVSFVLLSVFRSKMNAPRPYEVLDIDPLIHKDTKGHSFPSRHVFSVFVIAMVFLRLCPAAGFAFLAVGVLLAACRVIGGVHWPRDVLAGMVVGVLSGLLLWVL